MDNNEKISELIDTINELNRMIQNIVERAMQTLNDVIKPCWQSIVAISQIVVEVLAELSSETIENMAGYANLYYSLISSLKIYDSNYEQRLKKYRKKYKHPIKRFFSKHQIMKDICVSLLVELILSGAKFVGINVYQFFTDDQKETVQYTVEYNTNSDSLNIQIDTSELEKDTEVVLPDGKKLMFQMP